MKKREDALVELHRRLYDARVTLGLKGLKRTPTKPIDEKYLPCIFMVEDVDEITQSSGRGPLGYPHRRRLEVVLEIVTDRSADIKQLYRDVRSTILEQGVNLADDSFIQEIRTEGPTGYGLPDVVGMRLVFALTYTDEGF